MFEKGDIIVVRGTRDPRFLNVYRFLEQTTEPRENELSKGEKTVIICENLKRGGQVAFDSDSYKWEIATEYIRHLQEVIVNVWNLTKSAI